MDVVPKVRFKFSVRWYGTDMELFPRHVKISGVAFDSYTRSTPREGFETWWFLLVLFGIILESNRRECQKMYETKDKPDENSSHKNQIDASFTPHRNPNLDIHTTSCRSKDIRQAKLLKTRKTRLSTPPRRSSLKPKTT